MVRDLGLALSLCHNVTPTYVDGNKELQASSPDEVALVKFAETVGLSLIDREEKKIVIKNAGEEEEHYEILANFPFSSETKRMGIILRHIPSKKIIFYLKGAETVMLKKIRPNQRASVSENCESLAMEGLRTLIIA